MTINDDLSSAANLRRVRNLRTVAARYEQQIELAKALDITPSYLSQLIGPNPSRAISERSARQMERTLGLEPGFLDTEQAPPNVVSGDVLDDVMLTVDTLLRAKNLRLDAAKYRALVKHVYVVSLKQNPPAVDRTNVESLLELLG